MGPFARFKVKITAAEGYLELGMPLEANEELEQIEAEQRGHTDVLALRVQIYSALKKWELMQTVAKQLALIDPDNGQWMVWWAYATRRADSIEAARRILSNAAERSPEVAIFQYNLACYECQLGDVDEAKRRLKRAFELEPGYRLKALDEADLEAVWSSL